MKNKFHWQPEIATSIIYWSVTFFILFFSLIMALERTHPYPESIAVTIIALIFIYLGTFRSIVVKNNRLYVRYARFWKKKTIILDETLEISNNGRHLVIKTKNDKLECMMSKKAQSHLFLCIMSDQQQSCKSNKE